MITQADIRHQVQQATDASAGTYNVDAIVDTIQDRYGRVDINTIDHDEFWHIVVDHATS